MEKLRFKTGKGAKPKILLKSLKLGSLCGLKMLSSDDGLANGRLPICNLGIIIAKVTNLCG